jgi:putative flippase GtrA
MTKACVSDIPSIGRFRFFRYVIVAAVVGVLTVFMREVIAWLLPSDTPEYYTVSIVCAYIFGMVANFLGQRAITFADAKVPSQIRSFVTFIVVAVFGLVLTTLLSLGIRYTFWNVELPGTYAGTFSFAAAVALVSVVTFVLHRQLSFSGRHT